MKKFLGDGLPAEDSYLAKKAYLDQRFTPVEPLDFYRELYPVGTFEQKHPQGFNYGGVDASERHPNGIVMELAKSPSEGPRKAFRWVVTDDLATLEGFQGTNRFGLMAPVGYSGVRRDLKHAYTLYAMTFDLDEPNVPLFFDNAAAGFQPQPTFTVLSGHGLHLYYQFEEPQALYPRNMRAFKTLKMRLTRQIWNVNTSHIEKPQYQGINQGFRIVGGASKLGADYPVQAWRSGPPVSVDYLTDFLFSEKEQAEVRSLFAPPSMTWQAAKEKYPEWASRKSGAMPQTQWHVKRDLYDWWKKQWLHSTTGHRYFYVMCLAIYAAKCGVGRQELRRDAMELRERLDDISPDDGSNPFTATDINAALKAYDDKYVTFTRDSISELTAITITPNRRNYRRRADHLFRVRAVQNALDPDGHWREGNGRPSKEKLVRDYVARHPQESPTQIARALHVSRPTVYKYLN